MDNWTLHMFISSVAGSLAGLFWPLAIAVWRKETRRIYGSLSEQHQPGGALGVGGRKRKQPPWILVVLNRLWLWLQATVVLLALPVVRIGLRAIWIIFIGIIIATIASSIGFASFLHEQSSRQNLEQLGGLSYFIAFNYGFGAASLVEEALKSTSQ